MFDFNKNKRIKVIGEISRLELENNKHYPVFKFTTLEGKDLELRNIPKDPDIQEISVEDTYTQDGISEFLNKQLPIKEITIKYKENDPTDFIAIWI